jgi:5-formyltetrahydrofolate cyclo-ligase
MTDKQLLTKQQIRETIIAQRHQLSSDEQNAAALALWQQVEDEGFLHSATHCAFYQANAGEAPPDLILQNALAHAKYCYLPKCLPGNQLEFYRYQTGDTLLTNQYGIEEPDPNSADNIAPEQLNIVFCPLVAFDEQLYRLGRGAGYYDRTFAFRHDRPAPPLLVGLAYDFQYVTEVPAMPHDLDLDVVVTPDKIYRTKSKE